MQKEKEKLTEVLQIRLSPYEKNFIRGLANLYAGGNISLFLVYAAFNCVRKELEEDDLVESNRRIRKGRKKLMNPIYRDP